MCDPPRIYPSQNIPPSPTTIGLYATLPEYRPTSLSQNISPFSTTGIICNFPRINPSFPNTPPFQQIYAALPEYTPPFKNNTPLFNNYNLMRRSQNLPLPPYPLFSNYMRHSQNLPLPPRIGPTPPPFLIFFVNKGPEDIPPLVLRGGVPNISLLFLIRWVGPIFLEGGVDSGRVGRGG